MTMNANKNIGTRFERQACDYLKKNGWWAHFISPNQWGAQPFDIIAIRGNQTYAMDCKTCKTRIFLFSRIEINQYLSFSILTKDTTVSCGFLILHNDEIYYIDFNCIQKAIENGDKSITLTEDMIQNARNRFERNKDCRPNS